MVCHKRTQRRVRFRIRLRLRGISSLPVRRKRRGDVWQRSATFGRAAWALKTNMICCSECSGQGAVPAVGVFWVACTLYLLTCFHLYKQCLSVTCSFVSWIKFITIAIKWAFWQSGCSAFVRVFHDVCHWSVLSVNVYIVLICATVIVQGVAKKIVCNFLNNCLEF